MSRLNFQRAAAALVVLVAAFTWAMPQSVQACSCARTEPNLASRAAAVSSVVEGKIIWTSTGLFGREAVLKVTKSWKGPIKRYVRLNSAISGPSCGYQFHKNEQGIFFGTDISSCNQPGHYRAAELGVFGQPWTNLTNNFWVLLFPSYELSVALGLLTGLGSLFLALTWFTHRRKI